MSASPEQTSTSPRRPSRGGGHSEEHPAAGRRPADSRDYERELLYAEAVEHLRAITRELGLTQHELAGRLQVSDARLSHIMSGRANLTLATIAELGWAVGMRFALVAVPLPDRAETPAAHDRPAPPWLESHARLICERVAEALRREAASG